MNKFFAAVMNVEKTHLAPAFWSASSNGEISFEVRKWFEDNRPDVWEEYLDYMYFRHRDDDFGSKKYPIILTAQLSIDNFYAYLTEHFQEWGYKECQYCDGLGPWLDTGFDRKACPSCHGSGTIPRWPEVEEILEEK